MTDPTVCAILLTRDRPAMAKRAVESFRRQTYRNRGLLVYNTGPDRLFVGTEIAEALRPDDAGKTIGEIRNLAMNESLKSWDVICHWDDDDWSHPNRIVEQVALLISSSAAAVGYSDLLFWDTRKYAAARERHEAKNPIGGQFGSMVDGHVNEAWLYSRPTRLNVPGTTLCYWRKTWERKLFPHLPEVGNPTSQGEDIVWQAGLKVEAVSSFCETNGVAPPHGPRMIASVHSGNTMAAGYSHMGHVEEFARTPEWDSYCRRVMEIK